MITALKLQVNKHAGKYEIHSYGIGISSHHGLRLHVLKHKIHSFTHFK